MSSNSDSVSTPGSDGTGRSRTVTVGRYLLHRQIARGGMATIHIARLMGDEGFSRVVAAKRLLPEFAEDTDFVAMFMDEARIASKVHHRNVVPVLDLVTTSDEVMLVQEYVHGVPLHILLRTAKHAKKHIPPKIAIGIAQQVLAGLHAAHETSDEMGQPLNIVHRDVSPQNVMLATDGMARLLDFGVAKATMAAHVTRDGTFKGKLAYSAPEQLTGKATRQSDVYAATVVLWELLVGHRMHQTAQGEGELVTTIMSGALPTITEALANEREWDSISDEHWKQLETVEPIVKKGLAVDLAERYATAAAMEEALSKLPSATPTELGNWVKNLGKEFLEGRDKLLAEEEQSWRRQQPQVSRRTPLPGELRAQTSSIALEKAERVEKVEKVEKAADKNDRSDRGFVAMEVTHPPAPREGRSKGVVILGALVVILGIGLVFALRGGRDEGRAAANPPGPGTEVAKPVTGTGTGDMGTGIAGEAPTGTEAATKTAGGTESSGTGTTGGGESTTAGGTTAPANGTTTGTETGTTAASPTGTGTAATAQQVGTRKPVRDRTRPTGRNPRSQDDKKQPDKPVPTTTEKPANDCSPPYYFEGEKKVFKPQCL